ncbi:MAG: ATP-binding cassette domain-containing protein [Coriobacteriales bacterium]|nr:ATP-binding cassette domain-containing protein [Coriobacteriales bacterium]
MTGAHLSFADARVAYRTDEGDLTALDGISLEVAPGEPIAIIGPSGCGKSTLLKLAAGLLAPTSGQVLIDGLQVTGPRPTTSLILQDLGLLPWKTVEKNAELGLALRSLPRAERRDRARRALAQVGLAGFERRYPSELSGGMRQRLAFARALALDADLLLMDEPLSALDALSREALQQVLLELQQQRRYASVLVTHSIDEAVFLGRRIVVMTPRPGRIAGIVDNPGMGRKAYRASAEFGQVGRQVRSLLERALAKEEES